MKKEKLLHIILIVVFALLLVLPLLFVNTQKNAISKAENRVLAPFPVVKDSITGLANIHWYNDFETWYNDHIGFRDPMVEANSFVFSRLLGSAFHPSVHVGLDGWLFYTNSHNLEIAYGSYPLNDQDYHNLAQVQQAIQDSLQKRGMDYFFILTPSKCSIYPEKLEANLSIRETPADLLYNKVKQETTVKIINTKTSVLAKKDSIPLYFKTDSHWNDSGYYLAYLQILDSLRAHNYASNTIEIQRFTQEVKGDLAGMVLLPDSELVHRIAVKDPQAIDQPTEPLLAMTDSVYAGYSNYYNYGCYVSESALGDTTEVLIFGDSFIGYTLSRFVREHFKKCTFIWTNEFNLGIVDQIQPDLVIYERTERGFIDLVKDLPLPR